MRRPFFIALFLLSLTAIASADERQVFFGTWGTAKQCSREPVKPGGTVLSEPYEISARWLKQGRLWCNLSWGPVEARKDGYFTGTHAQCGEDAVRNYFLGMELSGDELRLRWDFPLLSAPLARCSGS